MESARAQLLNFCVNKISLEKVESKGNSVTLEYLINGKTSNVLRFEYDSISFNDPGLSPNKDAIKAFGVSLAVISFARFGAVLPRQIDISEFSEWIHPDLLYFFQKTITSIWSEHRYQLGNLSYHGPEILINEESLGKKSVFPIWKQETVSRKVIVASGSGKDSLLCMRLIEESNLKYDQFTYLHDLYGDTEKQDDIFNPLSKIMHYDKRHKIKIYDDFFPWLEKRIQKHDIKKILIDNKMDKPFRTEAGEVFAGSLALMPIQVVHGISLQVFGNEKSADFPNLIDDETGERIAHQYAKSFYGETALYNLYLKMFENMNRVSITKPIHDTKIFKTLFKISDELPYMTNSCNIKKPWCRKCEKCLYVFAGFSAFGDYEKTIEAFGANPMEDPGNLDVWKDLLGLYGRIPWECVGHPQETQLYFYKIHKSNIRNIAIDLFEEKILNNIDHPEAHFKNIEQKYSEIYNTHHHMPPWLWDKIYSILKEA